MHSFARWLIRYSSYPLAMVAVAIAVTLASDSAIPFLWLSMTAAAALFVVAMLERYLPYQEEWKESDADWPADVTHAVVNLLVIHAAVLALAWLRSVVGWAGFWWPHDLPFVMQVFLAGLPLDLSLYAMHRLSHHYPFLWRLHSIHHSSHRLYWLNGERRHPLHAAVMAGPGLIVLAIAGTPTLVVGAWFTILAAHLAFQHANLDYKLGSFRYLLGVAQVHRWHHRRRYQDAQVNFGEFWLIWDHMFRTFFDPKEPLGPIGIEGEPVPRGYMDQMAFPFKQPHH